MAPLGSLGYFAGHLWALPDSLAIAILTVLSFMAGIINSYGIAYSKGTLQALVGGAIAFGLAPEIHNIIAYWQVAALYLAGAVFYALLLGIEALIDQWHPQRQLLADYLMALAKFANAGAEPKEAALREQCRQAVIDQYEALYSELTDSRDVNSPDNQQYATMLQAGDSVFSALLAHHDPSLLLANGHWLQQLSYAVRHKHPLPAQPCHLAENNRLVSRVKLLATNIQLLDVTKTKADHLTGQVFNMSALWSKLSSHHHSFKLSHLIVSPEVISNAAKLALCMGLAYSMKYWVTGNHWYWIPLTVALVMKPELGSVFVRSVLRIIGTAIGVLIGSAMLMLVPKGIFLLLILIALAACVPWAVLRSYALQAILLTPLILILLDLASPGVLNINYANQRLMDTAIGGVIVLVFGYFIWPKSHEQQLASSYQAAMQGLANYLRAVCEPEANTAPRLRREVYRQLSNLRSQLQTLLSEPPPAGREAAKWFPIIMAAEQLTDRITIYADNWSQDDPLPDAEEVERLALWMQSIMAEGAPLLETVGNAELITSSTEPSAISTESAEVAALPTTISAAPAPQQAAFVADITYKLTLLARLLHTTTSTAARS